jgi:glycosyltransferase involved in cell wall biosynthesis
MRVIFDLTPLSTGSRFRGIGTYTLDLARALATQVGSNIDLRFLVGFEGQFELWPSSHALDIDTVVQACGGRDVTSYQRYYHQKRGAMKRFLAGQEVDLFHAPDPKGTPTFDHCKTVITAHDLIPTVMGWPYRVAPLWWSVMYNKRRYLPHTHVIAISKWTACDLGRYCGLPAERATVVYHGVDHERFSPHNRSTPPIPYFFYVGGFDKRKQVPDLIRAFGRISGGIKEELWIAGKPDNAQKRGLETAILECGASQRVKLLGFVDEDQLPSLYANATAHVLPTLYEGFGLTALEAMASGSPVVTLRATCVPEVCGDAAEYAEVGDWDTFSLAMRKLALDTGHFKQVRQKGLERAAEFTWPRSANETLAVYENVVNPC